jgi:hypothetical protein
MNKKPLLAAFIFPERLDWFLDYLEEKFNIPRDKVFVFKLLDDESKVMVTFKFINKTDKKVNFRRLFPDAIQIHKRGTCIYTINALNKLIEETTDMELGNINYKSVKINWDTYQDKLIIKKNGKLFLYNIKRIF